MTKKEKLASLETAMMWSTRGAAKEGQLDSEGEEYCHFSDSAPEELKELFMEHYEIRDLEYEIFKKACDLVSEIYTDTPTIAEDKATEEIYERACDRASVFTSDRLSYLNLWNENEISETMQEYSLKSISDACAVWYDRQVEQAACIINEWVNKKAYESNKSPKR